MLFWIVAALTVLGVLAIVWGCTRWSAAAFSSVPLGERPHWDGPMGSDRRQGMSMSSGIMR